MFSRVRVSVAAAGLLVLVFVVAEAAGTGYRIKADSAVPLNPGESTTISLTIAADPGYAISVDGQLKVVLTATPKGSLRLKKSVYGRDDAADPRAESPRFDLKLSATDNTGSHKLVVDANFWLCRKRTCRPVQEQLKIAIDVQTPPPPADAGVGAGEGTSK
jgi:hypothetical protein